MTISGTASLSGRIKYIPPVPNLDSSSNPGWFSDIMEAMACSARKEEEYTLVADGDTNIDFGSLTTPGANLIVIKVMPNPGIPPNVLQPNGVPAQPNPIVAKLTSPAGVASPISIDGFMFLLSASVAYTALTIARAIGVQTTVRIQMFAFGS